jgi:hypothetical protein
MREEMAQAKGAAVAAGTSAALGVLGVAMLLVALALAIFPGPWPAFIIALVLLSSAGGAAGFALDRVPKKPMQKTQRRISDDAHVLQERLP